MDGQVWMGWGWDGATTPLLEISQEFQALLILVGSGIQDASERIKSSKDLNAWIAVATSQAAINDPYVFYNFMFKLGTPPAAPPALPPPPALPAPPALPPSPAAP